MQQISPQTSLPMTLDMYCFLYAQYPQKYLYLEKKEQGDHAEKHK